MRESISCWRLNSSRTRISSRCIWTCLIPRESMVSLRNNPQKMPMKNNLRMIMEWSSSRTRNRFLRGWSTSWVVTSRHRLSLMTSWRMTNLTFTKRSSSSKCLVNTSSKRKSTRSTSTDLSQASTRWMSWPTNSNLTMMTSPLILISTRQLLTIKN